MPHRYPLKLCGFSHLCLKTQLKPSLLWEALSDISLPLSSLRFKAEFHTPPWHDDGTQSMCSFKQKYDTDFLICAPLSVKLHMLMGDAGLGMVTQ